MLSIINEAMTFITKLVSNGGVIFGVFMVMIEAFIPVLPLCAIVALNVNAFGIIIGTFISWISACMGSYLAYLIIYHLLNKRTYKNLSGKLQKKIDKSIMTFKKISFSNLVIITTLPFTPSSLINILAGVSGISKRKFFTAIVIGKFFMILFWAYVGKSFIESITDVNTIIIISLMITVAYLISKIVNKKMGID